MPYLEQTWLFCVSSIVAIIRTKKLNWLFSKQIHISRVLKSFRAMCKRKLFRYVYVVKNKRTWASVVNVFLGFNQTCCFIFLFDIFGWLYTCLYWQYTLGLLWANMEDKFKYSFGYETWFHDGTSFIF